jgi:hypothetical protein
MTNKLPTIRINPQAAALKSKPHSQCHVHKYNIYPASIHAQVELDVPHLAAGSSAGHQRGLSLRAVSSPSYGYLMQLLLLAIGAFGEEIDI